MNIFAAGINYKAASLEIRQKLSFSKAEQKRFLEEAQLIHNLQECILLSTCNRTEVYIYSDSCSFDTELLVSLLCSSKGIAGSDYKDFFYCYSGLKAVNHIFRVASGLDSMILGEDQILGQVKEAHERSMEAGASSGVLNTLFRQAVTAAKKVKTLTGLSHNPVSTASVAVKLINDFFGGNIGEKHALVIGCGEIGILALKNLVSKGIEKIYVTNRTHGKADSLAEEFDNVKVIDYADRYSVIKDCDMVLSATASPHYTITRARLESMPDDGRQRVFVDLAVPRDIDISIAGMAGIKHFDMDDLRLAVDENMEKRLMEASRAEEIIDEFIREYEKWYEFREVLPVIREAKKHAENILKEKMSQTLGRLKPANSAEEELVNSSIAAAVNGILNTFVYSVRDYGRREDIEGYFRCLDQAIRNVK